ncbi:MAG: ABC transporter permease, partial [Ruminiclostridium sp.]|nr:ABC transporter permease [Ruminiclostridium sp.]
MYLNILKKDLKRKKAMNVILLVFIILATMFVSSSVNNILTVTTALDNYFEMADVPDYLVTTMNKNLAVDIDEEINSADAVERYEIENVLFLSPVNLIFENDEIDIQGGTNIVQSDISLNYFLSDGSILETVKPGELYMTESKAEAYGVEIGDKLTIELNGASCVVTLKDKVKDALFGSNQVNFTRFIISEEDYSRLIAPEDTKNFYGGSLVYIYSSDVESVLTQIKPLLDNSI